MSTPAALPPASKATPRASGAGAAAASSPPAHLGALKATHKTPGAAHLAPGAAAAVHTPTPLGGAAPSPVPDHVARSPAAIGRSPAYGGPTPAQIRSPKQGRGRGSTLGAKSEVNTPGLSGLAGLGLLGGDGAIPDLDAFDTSEGHLRSPEQLLQRTREIANLLGTRWGRVSQESLVACVPRLGLEGMWEDGLPDAEILPGKNRNYIVAGKNFSVEIDWLGGRVQAVVLDLPNAREAAKRTLGRAAEILRKDLVGWENEAALGRYVDLKNFAENLQRLARTDQLSQEKASCFEALEGLFMGFTKIWEWEYGKHKASPTNLQDQKAMEIIVMCEGTGRPTMHANRRIGLKLDYWLDRRRAFIHEYKQPEGTLGSAEELWGVHDRLWSLLLECQPSDPTQYPPIRISDDWVSDVVGTGLEPNPLNMAAGIAWAEPPVLVISSEAESDGMDMDIDAAIRQAQNSTQPTVRFVARFDPPVVVAYGTAVDIAQLVGQPLGPEPPIPYLSLLFPEHSPARQQSRGLASDEEHALSFHRTLYAFAADGTPIPHRVQYKLLTGAPLPGYTLTEVPFSHPSQLVTILPVLRQWALLAQLLRRTAGLDDEPMLTPEPTKASETKALLSRPTILPPRPASPPSDTDSESESTPAKSSAPTRTEPVSGQGHGHGHAEVIDLTLTLAGGRLDLDVSPLLPDGRRAVVRVLVNGEVAVSLEGADEDGSGLDAIGTVHDTTSEASRVRKVLGVCEDLGMLAMWMTAHPVPTSATEPSASSAVAAATAAEVAMSGSAVVDDDDEMDVVENHDSQASVSAPAAQPTNSAPASAEQGEQGENAKPPADIGAENASAPSNGAAHASEAKESSAQSDGDADTGAGHNTNADADVMETQAG